MKDSNKLPFNIQFFADEEVLENSVAGEDTTGTDNVPTEGAETPVEENPTVPSEEIPEVAEPEQKPDVDAQFATIRRKAEEVARKKYESELKKRDAEFARAFGNSVNPVTGKPIQSVDEYLQAYNAQQQAQVEEQLKSIGADPSLISQLIATNPAVRQAQIVMEQQKVEIQDRQIASDITSIGKIDPSIKSIEDLAKNEHFPEIFERWERSGRKESLYDIFRLVNFDTLTSKKAEAAKQAAINQAKGKSHLEASKGVSTSDNMVDIPANELSVWKEVYPELSMSQLREKYNKTL